MTYYLRLVSRARWIGAKSRFIWRSRGAGEDVGEGKRLKRGRGERNDFIDRVARCGLMGIRARVQDVRQRRAPFFSTSDLVWKFDVGASTSSSRLDSIRSVSGHRPRHNDGESPPVVFTPLRVFFNNFRHKIVLIISRKVNIHTSITVDPSTCLYRASS